MLTASLAYTPLTNTVSITDGTVYLPGDESATYRLLLRRDGRQDAVLTSSTNEKVVRWVPGADGCYSLVLQSGEYDSLTKLFQVTAESTILYHLQLLGSLLREQQLYVEAVSKCHPSFRRALCERYTRRKAILAFQDCNLLLADQLLRTPLSC